ncbi:MAG: histidine kinase [Proteobacteria bacterium]|nr:histidine kinase [Pseudomonadota bacterium]
MPLNDARSTGFPSTGFDAPVAGAAAATPSVFDVCHVGVVLRALSFVLGVLVCGALFVADDWRSWPIALATGAGIALPGVLLWLLAACALRRTLGGWPLPAQWGAAIGLGALCGALGQAWAELLSIAPAGPVRAVAPIAAGALLAGVVFQWLHLRARAMLPADTRARLAELQSRIRPHFLFNTLNTALALVRVDPARAEEVLEGLAELFRVAISDSAAAVTLADEVALAQRYLAIEQIRFGTRLQVDWELDAAAGAARVPPLLLQPLVENAVRHGVEPADGGGTIRVRTRVRNGRAVLSITNSVPAQGSRAGHGMALQNVLERLHLMHDVAAHFEARLEGDVFRVQIVVPL